MDFCNAFTPGVGPVKVAGPIAKPSGSHNQQSWWIPVESGEGRILLLAAHVYRPSGNGRFPLVTINHGVPRDESTENLKGIKLRFARAAHWFVNRGFAVVVPLRRGFGYSDGDFSEQSGPCDNRGYLAEGQATAVDMRGVIEYMRQQSFVDSQRIVIVGQSGGGLGALTIATKPPEGVLGIISFAGARGSKEPGMVCCESALIGDMAVLGAQNKLPGLWLFSENDLYFGPVLADKLFASYSSTSSPMVAFVRLPPFGNDGHRTLYDACPDVWSEHVSLFLKQLGLEIADLV